MNGKLFIYDPKEEPKLFIYDPREEQIPEASIFV